MPDVLKTVGRYEILREVGRGGMAMVYLARQTDLDRFVALKELAAFHASDAAFAQRFLRESRVAGSLSHPNIVTVHDYFEHDGTPYIAMEYVERGSLRPFVGRMTLAQIGGVLEGLLAGLAQAEQHGIVHRDLKPENLMVTSDGRVKIADFGIAKATRQMQTGAFLTATGTTVGTPDLHGARSRRWRRTSGPYTDLYSVGCMAFELFTGNVPFHDSDAPMAILLRHVNEDIAPVKSIDPSIDQGVSDWIEQLLVKDPKERTQSANEAWDEFEELIIGLLGPRWRRSARLSEPRRPGRHAQAAHARAVRGHAGRRRAVRRVPELRVGPARVRHARGGHGRAARAGDAAAGRPARRADASPGRSTCRPGRRPRRRSRPCRRRRPPPRRRRDAARGGRRLPDRSAPRRAAEPPAAPPAALPPPRRRPRRRRAAPEPPAAAPPAGRGAAARARPIRAPASSRSGPTRRPPSRRRRAAGRRAARRGAAAGRPPADEPSLGLPHVRRTRGAGRGAARRAAAGRGAARPRSRPPPRRRPSASRPTTRRRRRARPWTSRPSRRRRPRRSRSPAPPPAATPPSLPTARARRGRPAPRTRARRSCRRRSAASTLEEEDGDDAAHVRASRASGAAARSRSRSSPAWSSPSSRASRSAAGGGDEAPPPETPGEPVAAESGSLALEMPAGYAELDTTPELPGLELEDAAAYAPGGNADGRAIVFGMSAANDSTLLPKAFRDAAGARPEQGARSGTAVALGPDGLQAYRYEDLELEGADRVATLYVVADDQGRGHRRLPRPARRRRRVQGRVRGDRQHARSSPRASPSRSAPTPATRRRSARRSASSTPQVDKGERALARNGATFRAQAAAARDIQAAYAGAARKLKAAETSPADEVINGALVKSLQGVADAWKTAAAEAADKDKAGFARSEAAIKQAQRQLAQTVKGLAVAGYDVAG